MCVLDHLELSTALGWTCVSDRGSCVEGQTEETVTAWSDTAQSQPPSGSCRWFLPTAHKLLPGAGSVNPKYDSQNPVIHRIFMRAADVSDALGVCKNCVQVSVEKQKPFSRVYFIMDPLPSHIT